MFVCFIYFVVVVFFIYVFGFFQMRYERNVHMMLSPEKIAVITVYAFPPLKQRKSARIHLQKVNGW